MANPENTEAPKLEFTPEVFDPKKAELQAIAEEVRAITADPSKMTKEDFELINTTKNKLVKARTRISKAGLAAREAANQYNRDVLAYEKELIAIIEPEEKRLKEIEAAAKEYAMTEERKKTLPEFIEKLNAAGLLLPNAVWDEAFLLTLDPNGRTEFYNERLSAKLEEDRAAADALRAEEDAKRAAEDKRLADEREKLERAKNEAELATYNSRVQQILSIGMTELGEGYTYHRNGIAIAKPLIKTLSNEEFEKEIQVLKRLIEESKEEERKEAEAKRLEDIRIAEEAAKEAERARLEKEESERKEAAEREAAAKKAEEDERSRAEAYQKFLNENSYNAETDVTEFKDGVTTLYRKVATYQHPK